MRSSPVARSVRRQSLTAALVLLAGAFTLNLAPLVLAAVAQVPLTTETLKIAATQYKLTPDQVKILQADIDYIAAAEKKVAAFKASLTPAQARTKDNLLKLQGLDRELMVAKAKLASDQAKFIPVTKK